MVTREVDGSLPVLVADAERSALLDQPLRNLEMSLNAGVVQRHITIIVAGVEQLRLLSDKPLSGLKLPLLASEVDRLPASRVASVQINSIAQQPLQDRQLPCACRQVDRLPAAVGAALHELWFL